MGRLTRDPEVRYGGANNTAIARYTLAVDRKFKREGEQNADFIPCLALGKNGEFAKKYLNQGMRITICGRIQTGSYTNQNGQKVYTTDVVVEEQEFAESKNSNQNNVGNGDNMTPVQQPTQKPSSTDGFMNIPPGLDEELPFN